MVKVIDPRNIAQPASARDPGVRIYNPGPAIAQAGRSLEAAARRLDAKEKEAAEKEQRVEDLRFLTAYEEAHSRRAESVSEEFRNREADADYVPGVSKRAEGFHKGIISEFGSRYSPSELALAQAERLHSRQFTSLRVTARANHNRAAAAQAVLTLEQSMDKDALAVASTPDPDVLAGALESIDERASTLAGSVDPVLLEQKRLEKREDATSNYFLGLLQEGELDLAEQQLRSGDFDKDLGDGTGKSRLLNQIKTERDAIARAAVAAYNKAHTAAAQTAAQGLVPDVADMQAAITQMPQGTRAAARTKMNALVNTARTYDKFSFLPETQRATILADARARVHSSGAVTEEQRIHLEALEKLDAEASAQQREDATVLVTNQDPSMAIDPDLPANIADPEYARRAAVVSNETTAQLGVGPNIQTLPRPAFDQVSEGIESGEESKRVAAYQFLSQLESDTLVNVLDTLGDDIRPATRVAISLAGSDPDLAIKIGRGEYLRTQQGGTQGRVMPSPDELNTALSDKLGGALRDSPQLRQDLTQAALSLYALQAGAEYDETAFEDILNKLVPDERLLDANGESILLPPELSGLSEDQFRTGLALASGQPINYVPNRAGTGGAEFPAPEFPERVGVAFDPSTGAPLQMPGFRMVAIVDKDGRPLDSDEVRKLRLREQISKGVYAAYSESAVGDDYAPVRVLYESDDGMVQRTAGFAVDVSRIANQALPQGRMPRRDNAPDDEDPLTPRDPLKHGTWMERFKKANDQFGDRVEMNFSQTLSNLNEAVDEPDDVTAAKDLFERLRAHIAETGKEDRRNPAYIALQDEVIAKFGSPEAFAQLLEQGGAIN